MSRDTCDELSTPATAIRRCAISVGVSDDTRRPTIYNASVPLSQQIGSHWTGTTGDGSTRRRPGTCVHSACPSPPAPSLSNQSTCIALPPARLRLPPGGEAPLRRSRGRFVYISHDWRVDQNEMRGGGMIPLFIFRAASLRSSVRALLPPDTVQSCT